MARYSRQQCIEYQTNKINYHFQRLQSLGLSQYEILKGLNVETDDLLALLIERDDQQVDAE